MKLGVSSLGKSKKQESGKLAVETNGSNGLPLVSPEAVDSPNVAKTPKDESSGKQGFIAMIASKASLKKKKKKKKKKMESNSGDNVNEVAVPAPLHISKSTQELKSAFRVYDSDSDGRISTLELKTVLTSLGGAISDEEVNQLMKQIDTDNDGFISLEEFVEFHRSSTVVLPGDEDSPVHDPMRDAFQMFDKDGDSRISASELQAVLVSLGDKGHSLEECKQMIKSVDKDGDGHVDFLEFRELMGGPD